MKKSRKILLIGTICAFSVIISGVVLIHSVWYDPSLENILHPISAESIKDSARYSYPARLYIPNLEVNARIEEVGITRKGNMATPVSFKDVGWYKYGTLPGMTGSAVIAGHVDNGLAFPAVFSKLSELKNGDDIYVSTDDNKTLHFVVKDTAAYDFRANTDKVFNDNSGKLLKLVTCTGTWLSQYKTHDQRLVVSAVLSEK